MSGRALAMAAPSATAARCTCRDPLVLFTSEGSYAKSPWGITKVPMILADEGAVITQRNNSKSRRTNFFRHMVMVCTVILLVVHSTAVSKIKLGILYL